MFLVASRLQQVFYNAGVKSWDVILVGGGIIGLSLAIALRKRGLRVLVVERGEPGREASHAAAGMLADCAIEMPSALQPLATASARMYPEYVHELEDESGMQVDLRSEGTILFPPSEHVHERPGFSAKSLLPAPLAELEPALADVNRPAIYLKERSVDPRALVEAAHKAAKHRGVDFSSGDPVTSVDLAGGRVVGVTAAKTSFLSAIVVNCAGAWSGQLPPYRFPTRPVKGQMLSVAAPLRTLLGHVVRAPEVYLVPRSNGRILIGSTLEEAGYDKRTDAETIRKLQQAAVGLIPELARARMLEAWAGLRPGTPDDLPILGATPTPDYYVAAGHFRDGILLASKPDYEIAPFSFARFAIQAA
ncbi:MAG: glycine oxidase ThiO [Acidobacteria bacterium]|nr:MAG: glycine oxidase ThiO [Acidobacteriota bacterium]